MPSLGGFPAAVGGRDYPSTTFMLPPYTYRQPPSQPRGFPTVNAITTDSDAISHHSHSSSLGTVATTVFDPSPACSTPGSHPCATTTSAAMQRFMDSELVRARQNGELPRTTASPLNAEITLEDYGHLSRLREARGDVSLPAPDRWRSLRVDVERRIRERDAREREEMDEHVAARRIGRYLHAVGRECGAYETLSPTTTTTTTAATTPATTPRSSFIFDEGGASNVRDCADKFLNMDLDKLGEEIFHIVEQAADSTLAETTGAQRAHNDEHGRLLESQRRQSQDILLRQHELADRQQALLQRHEELLAANMAMLSGVTGGLSRLSVGQPAASVDWPVSDSAYLQPRDPRQEFIRTQHQQQQQQQDQQRHWLRPYQRQHRCDRRQFEHKQQQQQLPQLPATVRPSHRTDSGTTTDVEALTEAMAMHVHAQDGSFRAETSPRSGSKRTLRRRIYGRLRPSRD